MIDPTDLKSILAKQPFQAFKIRMSDGNAYDVTNPNLVVPMETKLFLALGKDRWKFLSYQNVTSVESRDVAA